MSFLKIIKPFVIVVILIIVQVFDVQANPLQVWQDNPCLMPLRSGPCDGHFRRFAFADGKCVEFIFGGCEGNTKNFENPEKCQEMCRATSILTLHRDVLHAKTTCQMSKVIGPCTDSYKRYYYNPQSQECEEFIYGGCQGNENNFYNAQDCMDYCGAKKIRLQRPSNPTEIATICNAPGKVRGEHWCRHEKPRFSFSSTTKQCEEFIWSGCGGTQNMFTHGDECSMYCGATRIQYLGVGNRDPRVLPDGPPGTPRWPYNYGNNPVDWIIPIHPICLLPRVPGYCMYQVQTYSFNPTTRRCERSMYSGCNTNANSFPTAMDCMRFCPAIDVADVM